MSGPRFFRILKVALDMNRSSDQTVSLLYVTAPLVGVSYSFLTPITYPCSLGILFNHM